MPEDADAPAVWGLCAQWCGACREWRPVFEALAAQHPGLRFRWVDIEDEAPTLGDVDVETFPTVLIARGATPLFFGPVLPQPGALARLVQAFSAAGALPAPSLPPEAAPLLQALRRLA